MSIVSREWLVTTCCHLLEAGMDKVWTGRRPEPVTDLLFVHTEADEDIAITAAGVLTHCGPEKVRIAGSFARLGKGRMVATRLSWPVAEPNLRVVVVLTDRTPGVDGLLECLQAARRRRIAVLPVAYVTTWKPPSAFSPWPRIEEVENEVRIFGPDGSPVSYPLSRWLAPRAAGRKP